MGQRCKCGHMCGGAGSRNPSSSSHLGPLITLAEVRLDRALSLPEPMTFIFGTVLTRDERGVLVRKAKAL